jgi:hypothetical protein
MSTTDKSVCQEATSMIPWQNANLNKNGYVDFDDYMAEQANLNKNGYVDFDDYMAEQPNLNKNGYVDFDDYMAEQANLNKNGYVDFDDYMAEQNRRRKLTRKKKNNKKPIINNSSNYDRTIKIESYLDRIEGLDVFGTLEKRDNVNDLNVLTVLRNL